MLFRRKSKARLKADAKIKALKRENRDFVRGMMKFTALTVLTHGAAAQARLLRREPHRGEGDARLAEAAKVQGRG